MSYTPKLTIRTKTCKFSLEEWIPRLECKTCPNYYRYKLVQCLPVTIQWRNLDQPNQLWVFGAVGNRNCSIQRNINDETLCAPSSHQQSLPEKFPFWARMLQDQEEGLPSHNPHLNIWVAFAYRQGHPDFGDVTAWFFHCWGHLYCLFIQHWCFQ